MKLRALLRPLGFVALWVAVLASAVTAVYARHEARDLFVELERLNSERDQLNIEWGRLRIEQSTWATHARVEALAREELRMEIPPPSQVVVVQP
ncbi:MAG: cell division protein FtsL [Pseudomonadota bacterium]